MAGSQAALPPSRGSASMIAPSALRWARRGVPSACQRWTRARQYPSPMMQAGGARSLRGQHHLAVGDLHQELSLAQHAVSAAHRAARSAIMSGLAGRTSRKLSSARSTDAAAAATAPHWPIRDARASRPSVQPNGRGPGSASSGATSRSASHPHPFPHRSGPGSRADKRPAPSGAGARTHPARPAAHGPGLSAQSGTPADGPAAHGTRHLATPRSGRRSPPGSSRYPWPG